jgi:actin-like ATPase involved in cell morphogenesis
VSNGLGLSIGETNLVAAPAGGTALATRSILTVYPDRAPEVGVTTAIPNQGGLVLTGFVERVGDAHPLVAADGTAHSGETVLAEALDSLVRSAGGETPTAIAVPAHWGLQTVGALRAALRGKAALAGVPLVADSTAALAGLRAGASLPDHGVVTLCDFGGSGTSISLADADAGDALIGPTVRCSEFSGDLVDQAVLNQVISGLSESAGADPASTAAVGSLSALRDDCRRAKESLSTDTETEIHADLPGFASTVQLTRTDLEGLIDPGLTNVLTAVTETLGRNNIAADRLSAVAVVGGGAAIPLVAQRLSEHLGVPVVTSPTPALVAAAGARLVDPRALAADAATGMAPTMGWAAGAPMPPVPNQSAATSAIGALAWSDDDESAVMPSAAAPYVDDPAAATGVGSVDFADFDDLQAAERAPLSIPPWYRRPSVLFGAAAAAFLAAGGGLAVSLTSNDTPSGPVTENVTVTRTGSNGDVTTAVVPATRSTVTQTAGNGDVVTTVVPEPVSPDTNTDSNPTSVVPAPGPGPVPIIPIPIPMPWPPGPRPYPPGPWPPHPRPRPTTTTSTTTTSSAEPTTTTTTTTTTEPTTTTSSPAPTTTTEAPTTSERPTLTKSTQTRPNKPAESGETPVLH